MNTILNSAAFAQCLAQAKNIVASYRAEAPEGCDPQNVLACRPFDFFRTATESLPDTLLRRPSYMDAWRNVVPKGKYPQGKGTSQTVITIGNSEPESAQEQWLDVTLTGQQITINNGSETSACDNAYTDVAAGYDEVVYGPRRFQLRGPVICERALTYHHQVVQFLNAYETELAKRANRSWSQEMENQYMNFSQKIIDGELYDGDGAPNTNINLVDELPTSELTMSILETTAQMLIESDAITPDSDGYVSMGSDGPLFTIMMGIGMKQRLFRNLPERRIDMRYAEPSKLMQRLGATDTWENFRFLPTTHPPRFSVVNGKLNRIPPKITVSATHGTKAVNNPAYVNAEYEAAIVMLPSVFEAEVVVPMSGTPWAQFNPLNYNGEWQFVTGAYRLGIDCEDPQDTLGRHYATFEYAPKPKFPEHGKVLIYRRCDSDIELATCAS